VENQDITNQYAQIQQHAFIAFPKHMKVKVALRKKFALGAMVSVMLLLNVLQNSQYLDANGAKSIMGKVAIF